MSKNTTYSKIKEILEKARGTVYRNVNFVMVQAYWHIGKTIVEDEQAGKKKADYGRTLIKEISDKLTLDFGKGFNVTNISYMRQFYLNFRILHALRGELSWTHYRLLLKVEKKETRSFYIKECIENNWSTRQLERQINSFYYERLFSSKNKKAIRQNSKKIEPSETIQDIIKDPYVLEFLNIKDIQKYSEKELEKALINKLQEFVLELGKGFSFVARQKRISDDTDHYYIDLVFYVRYFEENEKTDSDNPTIGIILCSQKSETIVKYSVLKENKRLFASKYKLYLPTEKELKEEIEREKSVLGIV